MAISFNLRGKWRGCPLTRTRVIRSFVHSFDWQAFKCGMVCQSVRFVSFNRGVHVMYTVIRLR